MADTDVPNCPHKSKITKERYICWNCPDCGRQLYKTPDNSPTPRVYENCVEQHHPGAIKAKHRFCHDCGERLQPVPNEVPDGQEENHGISGL